MRVFHCGHCDNLVVFENSRCVRCDHSLAYLPDRGLIGALDEDVDGFWRPIPMNDQTQRYRLCRNYTENNICNWAISFGGDSPYCESCRLTRTIPDLQKPGRKEALFKIEIAKRRLIYTLLRLNLPITSRHDEPETGLAFEFLADPDDPNAARVLTGHNKGVITLNIAEADDAERERRRHQMHEPYRTLLGHLRHEIGHYYWDRLIKDASHLSNFRETFGDDREDYGNALEQHYQDGSPANWQDNFISAYASSHPWEDWAETWAHYLHLTDALETAADSGLSLRPKRKREPALALNHDVESLEPSAFDTKIENWHALSYVLNNLNRGMGLPDAYPFVLSAPVIEKLRFIHDIVGQNSGES